MRASFPAILGRLLLILAVAAPFAWLFGPALCTSRSFVFRDAAHYYFPLFQWIGQQWSQGELPLWNPQENCGVPVLADATSGVLYPGKLLFLLPLGYALKYKLYVSGHALLAAWTAFCLARRWRASPPAATLAALSYAFSGSVLFQYSNVVFLVGAAWLPLAVAAADRLLVERRLRGALILATVWALMVLGGDPQTAYHAGLLAVLQAMLLYWHERRVGRRADEWPAAEGNTPAEPVSPRNAPPAGSGPSSPPDDQGRNCALGLARTRPALLLAAAIAAGLLSAVQILPSVEWSARSQRAVFEAPRSVYEIPQFLMRPEHQRRGASISKGLFGPPASGQHHEHIYHFSVGPWRLAELVWPNISGRLYPLNHRWTTVLPAEGRTWTPSLYLGLVPLLLGVACFRLRRGPLPVRWATWTVLLAVAASFGWYGLGWVVQELRYGLWASGIASGAAPDAGWFGQPVGGLYWMLVVALPGYAMFRFPAKWFVVASLAFSLLAAWGLDEVARRAPRRLAWIALGLAAASLLAGAATLACGSWWESRMQGAPSDSLLGPLDAAGALADVRTALWHGAAVAAAFFGLLRLVTGHQRRLFAPAVLLLTAIDLAVAHSWLIPLAPLALWEQPGPYADAILERDGHDAVVGQTRVYRGSRAGWMPDAWSHHGSPSRQSEGLRWDVETLFPKYQLASGLSLVESYGTFSSHDFAATLRIARRHGFPRPDHIREPHRGVLDVLGANYLLLPGDVEYPKADRVPITDRGTQPVDSSLWFNPQALPRAWIVHRVQIRPKLESPTAAAVERRTRQVWFPQGIFRDLRAEAVIEVDDVAATARRLAATSETIGSGQRIGPAASEHQEPAPKATDREASGHDVSQSAAARDDGLQDPSPIEHCRLIRGGCQRLELDVRLERPGLVVVSDLYYPGWRATRRDSDGGTPQRLEILQTNRVMRGVWLPAGRHVLSFAYRPVLFYAGAALSLIAWSALAVAALLCARLFSGRRRLG